MSWVGASAVSIAAAVRSGEVSATEVTEEHLAAISERDGDLNAFNTVLAQTALSDAIGLDLWMATGGEVGPLAGVPVALKDNLCTHGVPTTCSSRMLEGWRPPYNATVVDRIRSAGGVMIGKTNLDEFAMGSSTESSAFGPTRNPHDPKMVPGGSSGGSAAAVAAGMAPLALGSDTGGSTRQPASLCGVVGLKPTYGLVSRYGLVAFASSLDQVGPLAANVQDAAALLDAISGHDPADSTSIPQAPSSALATLDQGVDGLRIGIVSELLGDGISPEVARAVEAAGQTLSAAGAQVAEVSLPTVVYGLSAYYLIGPAEASSNLARYDGVRYGLRVEAPTAVEMMEATRTAGFGDEVKRRIMLGTYALSSGYYDAYYRKAQKIRTLMAGDFEKAYRSFDLLLAPTSPTAAFPIGERAGDPLAMYGSDICTIPANLVGHPAMSVPFGSTESGLPLGVQLMAPAMGEPTMLRAARVVEAAAPELTRPLEART